MNDDYGQMSLDFSKKEKGIETNVPEECRNCYWNYEGSCLVRGRFKSNCEARSVVK